jgi:ferredoxin
MDPFPLELVDITAPPTRSRPLSTTERDLLIVGVPVYVGRVPELLSEWFQRIYAQNTPTVGVVVYGNRAYDDALIELRDILTARGCVPVAFGAYIGEHSFSTPETPIAAGRPDAKDLDHARIFGRRIFEKLKSLSSLDDIQDIGIPGVYPYGGSTELWSVDFMAVGEECTQCGICADECPVGAIDPEDSERIDREKCITCCACIKSCPEGARTMKASPVRDVAVRLNELHAERKEPVFFL